jgi:hypothetical protein
MSKVKIVTPTGKVIYLGAKAANQGSLRRQGYRLYEEVYASAPELIADPLPVYDSEEKPKRGRPRKNTMSDADQA